MRRELTAGNIVRGKVMAREITRGNLTGRTICGAGAGGNVTGSKLATRKLAFRRQPILLCVAVTAAARFPQAISQFSNCCFITGHGGIPHVLLDVCGPVGGQVRA
jgi:hypothetical protein